MIDNIQVGDYILRAFVLLLLSVSINSSLFADSYVNKEIGFSINLTNGFQFDEEEDGVFYFVSAPTSGNMVVMNWPGLSMDDVREAMVAGYQEEGVYLTPRGRSIAIRVNQGQGMAVEVEGIFAGQKVTGLLAGTVGGEGQGLVILIATVPEKWDEFSSLAPKLIQGFSMIKIIAGPEVKYWMRWLSGKRLAHRRTYGDYSGGGTSSEDYYLCNDGAFLQSGSSSDSWDGVGGFGYGQTSQRGTGTWQVKKIDDHVRIIFNYHNGYQQWANLEEKDGKTLLNGSTYFVVENDQCQ